MSAFTATRNVIAAAWAWLVLGTAVLVCTPLILLWRFIGWPVDRENYLGGRLFRLCAVAMVRLTPRWHFTVRGTVPANPRLPYVVVANHESFADIVLLSHLPWEMKWLSKVELMWIPILGWAMWGARDVGVKRGRATSAKLAMAACRQRLANHVSIMMFPEGTRSLTTDMLPFKDGAFRLAIETGAPILPLAIHGTRNAIAKHDWKINPATAVVQILEPVPSAGMALDELKEQVRTRIQAARDQLRAEF